LRQELANLPTNEICRSAKDAMIPRLVEVGMERSLLVPGCLCKWLSPERISKEGLRWRAATREPQVLEGRRGSLFFEYDAGTL
jgi:hypothetical protein